MGAGGQAFPHEWGRGGLLLGLGLLLLAGPGCSSRYKKLSQGGSMTDVLFYDVLGRDRSPEQYYDFVRKSHREKDFCYECASGDPFLVDKNIDALERLGHADFGRLEGVGEVVELMSEVVTGDRSALARAQAATSMTKIALRLPRYEGRPVPDDGGKLLRYMQDVDRAYLGAAVPPPSAARGATPVPSTRRTCPPASRALVIDRIGRIGDLAFASTDLRFYWQAIRFFYGRPYLVDEQDPQLRQAIDTALTKRIQALVHVTLASAVLDREASVREDAIRGLKTLEDADAVETIAEQIRLEAHWLVRLEAAEYFGRVGTRTGVKMLIGLLGDANASVRHKARESLSTLAGEDFGTRAVNWKWWARRKDPTIVFEGEGGEDGAGSLPGR